MNKNLESKLHHSLCAKINITQILAAFLSGFLVFGVIIFVYYGLNFKNFDHKTTVSDLPVNPLIKELIKTPFGIISVDFGGQSTAKLLAVDFKGKKSEIEIPFGVDNVIKASDSDNLFYVIATNRENDRIIGFDKVFLVDFEDSGPLIKVIIPSSGFGAYNGGSWFYIKQNDRGDITKVDDLKIETLAYDGEKMSEWNFGNDLVNKSDWKGYSLESVEILSGDRLLISMMGDCGIQEKYPVCAEYIIDPANKKIKSVEK